MKRTIAREGWIATLRISTAHSPSRLQSAYQRRRVTARMAHGLWLVFIAAAFRPDWHPASLLTHLPGRAKLHA